MRCDDCIFKKTRTTGIDEYPMLTTIPYCQKGHWDDDPTENFPDKQIDFWDNCQDYKTRSFMQFLKEDSY